MGAASNRLGMAGGSFAKDFWATDDVSTTMALGGSRNQVGVLTVALGGREYSTALMLEEETVYYLHGGEASAHARCTIAQKIDYQLPNYSVTKIEDRCQI